MFTKMRKAVLTAACVTVAPLLLGSASDANANTYVSGSISFGSPNAVAVFGYSNANPYSFGHVHSDPIYCDEGPLYYYPAYHVYAHYYPRVHYYSYARPRYFYPRHHAPYVRHDVYPRHRHPQYRDGYSRGGHSRGYVSEIRGHRPGRDHGYSYQGGNGHGKSRGHGNGRGKYKGSHNVRGHGDR